MAIPGKLIYFSDLVEESLARAEMCRAGDRLGVAVTKSAAVWAANFMTEWGSLASWSAWFAERRKGFPS